MHVFVLSCCAVLALLFGANGQRKFGPKKLYTLPIPTDIVSVNVVAKDLVIVGPWYIGQVQNVHWKFRQSSRMRPRVINHDIPNPRAVGKIPNGAFKKSKELTYWTASWGTNDTQGAMFVLRPTTTYSVWKDITVDDGWNYERSQWVDMNKDGYLDCLTARFRGGVGQMLWFEQPAGNGDWAQHIVHEGMADGNFVGFVKGKKTYILVAGLQFSALGLYWVLHPQNNWSVMRQVRHRVIDNYGKFYDVEYVDLNRDGRPDILTTTVNIGNSRGHVLGYEVPDDLQNKIWKRRVLAAGFTGDYSPGKATAFWPNKWKRASDRPSVFLSGAGAETLYILTPTPKKSGWGYIRSSLKAGVGMIGIPYIGDIDGDSYPELFVPQGKELHVFSYDYNAAAMEPPAPTKSPKALTKKPVPYRNPFYRPTTPAPRPAIRRPTVNRTQTAAGTSSAGAPGSSGGSTSSGNTPPIQYFFPGGNVPSVGEANGETSSSSSGGGNRPSGAAPPQTAAGAPRTGGASGGSGSSSLFSLWPVMTSNGPAFVPIANPNANVGTNTETSSAADAAPANNNPSPGRPYFAPVPGGTSNVNSRPSPGNAAPSSGGVGGGGSRFTYSGNNNNVAVPSSNNNAQSNTNAEQPIHNNPNLPYYAPTDPPIRPINGNQPNYGFSEYGWNNGIIPINANPSGYNGTNSDIIPFNPNLQADTYSPQAEAPANLMLSVTTVAYGFREEAADACSFENKVLCSLEQLSIAKKSGPLPDGLDWGWFEQEGRAAMVEECIPGKIKWDGYACYNGEVSHTPVKQQATFIGLCCSVLRGAQLTQRKFSNSFAAADYCKYNKSLHLCTLEDLYRVWDMSSYKDDQWRFYESNDKLAKMVHTCDPEVSIWPGYACYGGGIVTSEMNGFVQEKALCCPNSSCIVKFNHVLFLLIFIVVNIFS